MEIDKTKFVVFSIIFLIIAFCVYAWMKPKDTKKKIEDVEIKLKPKSVIGTKLEAYKKSREEEKKSNSVDIDKVSFYDQVVSSKTDTLKDPKSIPEDATKVERSTETKKQETPIRKKSNSVSQEKGEKKEIKNEIDPEEKARRKALLAQAWGKENRTSDEEKVNIDNTYPAVIHGEQVINKKGSVRIRLKKAIKVNGDEIPANTLITGIASVTGDRLNITINSVRVGRKVISVPFEIYGADGLKGLPLQSDETKQLVNDEVSGEVIDELDKAARTLTKGMSGVVSGIVKGVKKKDDVSTTLYDNTSVYLKILQKRK